MARGWLTGYGISTLRDHTIKGLVNLQMTRCKVVQNGTEPLLRGILLLRALGARACLSRVGSTFESRVNLFGPPPSSIVVFFFFF